MPCIWQQPAFGGVFTAGRGTQAAGNARRELVGAATPAKLLEHAVDADGVALEAAWSDEATKRLGCLKQGLMSPCAELTPPQVTLAEEDGRALKAVLTDAAAALAALRGEGEELRGLAEAAATEAERSRADADRLRKAAEDAALDRCASR